MQSKKGRAWTEGGGLTQRVFSATKSFFGHELDGRHEVTTSPSTHPGQALREREPEPGALRFPRLARYCGFL
jgi:hypothetical protein